MNNILRSTKIRPGIIFLIVLMGATRFHHFGSTFFLPDASLAVFFLAGLWFSGLSLFGFLLLEAGLIDYIAITQFGVSDFCISPAYVFLIPTYAALWFGGRYSVKVSSHRQSLRQLAIQFIALLMSVSIAFLISNGSFYLLSDKITNINWAEYSSQVIQYYPSYLNYSLFYVVLIYGIKQLFNRISLFQTEAQ